jgi:hypothetical protein
VKPQPSQPNRPATQTPAITAFRDFAFISYSHQDNRERRAGKRALVKLASLEAEKAHSAPSHALKEPPTRILVIGDSMSVGAFGQSIEQYLATRLGRNNFALFASCGSSPENWLRSEPDYYTTRGYREVSPERQALIDFHDGKPPPRIRTRRWRI